jgi:sulfite reductase (NADPH) flavoprotein alpha-component
MSTETRVWYFAYGSNMQKATFVDRRGMRPDRSVAASLTGYRLTFDLPIGSGERGVANIAVDPGASVHGVLHRITVAELEFLDRTEGVTQGAYDRIVVSVATGDGSECEAHAYISSRGVEGRKPSDRYIGLLLDGALEYGLPASYVRWLEALPRAIDEREHEAS